MNKLKLGLLVFAANFFLFGFSQLNDFDLSTYKLPDLERRSLETNFNISGYNHYEKTPYPPTVYVNRQTGTSQYNGNISLDYNHFLNNTKYQRRSNFGLAVSSYFSNRKEDKELMYKNSDITPVFYFQRDNRKYYDEKSFLETDLILNYQYEKGYVLSKNIYGSEAKDKLQTHTLFVQAPVKFGNGRIEQVQDAKQAIYIYKELSKVDRMSPDKTNEQILEFAKLISQLKNKRFFDSRLRRIADIESVDSFFTAKNYIKESDATYFTTLSDYWEYGNGPVRSSGTRFSIVLLPEFNFYDYSNPGGGMYYRPGKYSLGALSLNGGMEFKHEKPINLFWQNSLDLNCYFGIIEGKLNDKTYSFKDKIRIPNIQLSIFQTIGFYPNTRTDISIGYSVQYVQLFDKTNLQNEIQGAEGKGAKAATDISVNYYISPKFRLNIASSFYYIWQDSKDRVTINFDNVAESDYLSGNIPTIANGYIYNFKNKEFTNNFVISLIYSLF